MNVNPYQHNKDNALSAKKVVISFKDVIYLAVLLEDSPSEDFKDTIFFVNATTKSYQPLKLSDTENSFIKILAPILEKMEFQKIHQDRLFIHHEHDQIIRVD